MRVLGEKGDQNDPLLARARVLGGKLPKGDFMTEGMKGGIMECTRSVFVLEMFLSGTFP